MAMYTSESERDWRRVIHDSHGLWCDCGDWREHLYCVYDSHFQRRPTTRAERRAANWRRQMRRLHRLWCFCQDWKCHALYAEWDGKESDDDSSASSSGEAPEQQVPAWKTVRAFSRAYHHRINRGLRGTPPPRNLPGYEHASEGWRFCSRRERREDDLRTRAEPDRVVFQLGGVPPRRHRETYV
ncbi:protein US32 [Human betaherpesvirus 5]|uniref:Protein US32 n=1 Tax=Human cytomegalovirus TaxID=10359 RepID=E7DVV8_HCMV|nr:protein US32 [Human betaherpesvirus 5]